VRGFRRSEPVARKACGTSSDLDDGEERLEKVFAEVTTFCMLSDRRRKNLTGSFKKNKSELLRFLYVGLSLHRRSFPNATDLVDFVTFTAAFQQV
jgi:hypothetical protein